MVFKKNAAPYSGCCHGFTEGLDTFLFILWYPKHPTTLKGPMKINMLLEKVLKLKMCIIKLDPKFTYNIIDNSIYLSLLSTSFLKECHGHVLSGENKFIQGEAKTKNSWF